MKLFSIAGREECRRSVLIVEDEDFSGFCGREDLLFPNDEEQQIPAPQNQVVEELAVTAAERGMTVP